MAKTHSKYATKANGKTHRAVGKSPSDVLDFIVSHGGRTSDMPMPDRKPKPATRQLRFIDLFCGIGGFRIAFERAGAKCVFSSDWDKFARQTYAANFGEEPHGDINQIPVDQIPSHDILCGGFPCQPFSIAGALQ